MLSYTAEELERETGFDRRTIAYYIQEGLIPRVGRRGPRTRYPKLARDRLLFIRRVREAEEGGVIPPVSLTVMGELFARLSPEAIASVADGETAVTESLGSSTSTQPRSLAARRDSMETRHRSRRAMVAPERRGRLAEAPRAGRSAEPGDDLDEEPGVEYSLDPSFIRDPKATIESAPISDERPVYSDSPDGQSELGESLVALQEAASRRQKLTPTSVDTWSRIEISPDIALSVRGITNEDAGLLEKVRTKLKQLISDRRR